MAKLLIKNGRVIDPASRIDRVADVLIEDGRIAGAGENMEAPGAEIFDASGMIVAPGFIDMHVHLREPGFEHAETIESGSRAAAAGGFTSICSMPNTAPVNDSATVTKYIVERARLTAVVNVFPVGAITKDSAGEALAAIGAMREAGAVAISDDGRPVMNACVMRRAMEFAKAFDMPVINHCEDLNLSAGGDMHEGYESVRLGLRGIPSSSEDVMVARDLVLAEVTDARYHVAHISARRSVRMVAAAKAQGLPVTCEATPHHFSLADTDIVPYDSNFKMKPPLRALRDVSAVTEGIVDGTVDAIATDHAPHPGSEKMQEFERCPFGIIGLETALALALTQLVHPGKISLARLVLLMSTNPARIIRRPLGRLAVGAVADITILDPNLEWTYHVAAGRSKSRNSPFDGWPFKGAAIATIVAGKIVYRRAA